MQVTKPLLASIETHLRVSNDDPNPLAWTATAESILAKFRHGRFALQQVVTQN